MNDTTRYLVGEASNGPGDRVLRFRRAKAHVGPLNERQRVLLARLDGARLEYVSKALLYAEPFRWLSKAEASDVARLVKGGRLCAERLEAPAQGYVLRAVTEGGAP